MGNGESTFDSSQEDSPPHPISYAGSAGSSVDNYRQLMQQPTFIADNFNSLDQVFTVPFTC